MLLSAGYQNKINLFIYARLQKSPLPLQTPCEQVSAFCSSEGRCCIVVQMFSEKVHLQGLKVYREQNLQLPNVGEISPARQHRISEDRKPLKECLANCQIPQTNCGSLGLHFIFLHAQNPFSSVLP